MFPAVRRCMLVSLLALAACGGAQVSEKLRAPIDTELSDTDKYVQSLRLSALARIEVRAGQDGLAAEYFRNAYRLHPASNYLVSYAQAAERAGWLAEALDALRQLLGHDLSVEQRSVVEAQVKRVSGLVPAELQRIDVVVEPRGARVELSGDKVSRLLLSSGAVWLKPGSWRMETTAKGFSSELRTVQLGPGESDVVRVRLQPEDQGPMVAQTPAMPPAQPQTEAMPRSGIKPQTVAEGPPSVVVQPQADLKLKPGATMPPVVTQATAPKPQGQPWLHKVGPWATTALGAVALGAGGWLTWQMKLAADEANAALPATGNAATWYASQQDAISRATTNSINAQYSFAVGGALVVAGSLWWALAPKPRRDSDGDETASVALRPALGLAGATLVGTF